MSIFSLDELAPRHGAVPNIDARAGAGRDSAAASERAVERLVEVHRQHGYRYANLDPTGSTRPLDMEQLSLIRFGLSAHELLPPASAPWPEAQCVDDLQRLLQATYCGELALDASAVRDDDRRAWLFRRMESACAAPATDAMTLLARLVRAQSWEHYVAQRFPHGKRFSLEGCEALIPMLDALLEDAARRGIADVFMGMPHRGRLNVLANVLRMPVADILDYFDPHSSNAERHRDLVYHLGAHGEVSGRPGRVAVTLACNPSHLQSVLPVVVGMACASRVAHARHGGGQPALAIVLHGDAAFAGQGVVMETLALGQKPGYAVGGTVHVIINNQIGFTEPNPMSAQVPRFCTDVTRMVDSPVLRVNADAPEAVLRAAAIALDFRMMFGADVVIDLIGYRRLGHSEHDAPILTLPNASAVIAAHASVVERYAAQLVADDLATAADMAAHLARLRADALRAFAQPAPPPHAPLSLEAARLPALPAFSPARLRAAVAAMTTLPTGFEPHPMIAALIEDWRRAGRHADAVADWCLAENMAYASVLGAGVDVRVSGLDVRRGTFFHRHAAWSDQSARVGDAEPFIPLHRLGAPGRFDVLNSLLSEEAVVGFEYGYSVQAPNALTIWEAQYGDFVNGAQVFLDQYLSAGEEKWGYRSPLVLLLPHGYEGVGPEHSSGFLGRFLALCGAGNLRVACPSTSAQFFHLLRRQAFDAVRKPLIVMTPKATLHGDVDSHSPVRLLHEGVFEPVLVDPAPGADVTRIVVCSGKLFHDLARCRAGGSHPHVALLRLEEMHPFPHAAIAAALARHPGATELVWAQEETKNQGAWSFVRDELAAVCPPHATLGCVTRAVTAAGATSSAALHRRQQAALVREALGAPRAI